MLELIKMNFFVAFSIAATMFVYMDELIRDQVQVVHVGVHMIKDNIIAIRQHQEGSKEWTMEQKLIFQLISTLDFSAEVYPNEIIEFKQGASQLLKNDVFDRWLH